MSRERKHCKRDQLDYRSSRNDDRRRGCRDDRKSDSRRDESYRRNIPQMTWGIRE
ncbi:hypothetical protein Tco_1365247, partial [Tanacetum coccineum]